jgi:hypothetical protein
VLPVPIRRRKARVLSNTDCYDCGHTYCNLDVEGTGCGIMTGTAGTHPVLLLMKAAQEAAEEKAKLGKAAKEQDGQP